MRIRVCESIGRSPHTPSLKYRTIAACSINPRIFLSRQKNVARLGASRRSAALIRRVSPHIYIVGHVIRDCVVVDVVVVVVLCRATRPHCRRRRCRRRCRRRHPSVSRAPRAPSVRTRARTNTRNRSGHARTHGIKDQFSSYRFRARGGDSSTSVRPSVRRVRTSARLAYVVSTSSVCFRVLRESCVSVVALRFRYLRVSFPVIIT